MAERSGADLSPERVYTRLVGLGEDWAQKNAAAQLFEDTQKATLNRIALAYVEGENISATMAEKRAYASQEYTDHVAQAVEARRAANEARVKYDCAKIWAELLRSANANRREEMRLAGMG